MKIYHTQLPHCEVPLGAFMTFGPNKGHYLITQPQYPAVCVDLGTDVLSEEVWYISDLIRYVKYVLSFVPDLFYFIYVILSDYLNRSDAFIHTSMVASRACGNLNSSLHSAVYMRQWVVSALVQIMACRLFGTKPLFEPINRTLRNNLQWHLKHVYSQERI